MDKAIQTEPEYLFDSRATEVPPQTPIRGPIQSSGSSVPLAFEMPTLIQAAPMASPYPPLPSLYYWPVYPNTLPSIPSQPQVNRVQKTSQTGSGAKRSWRTAKQKTEEILDLLKEFNWSLGDLFDSLFLMPDVNGKPFNPSSRHCQVVAKFLSGETRIGVSEVLQSWIHSSYGLPPGDHSEREFLYSTEVGYLNIRYARPAMTSFSAQLIQKQLVREAQKTVKKDGGLHTFTSNSNEIVSQCHLGSEIFPKVMNIFQTSMPLTWKCLLALARSNETPATKARRPSEFVVTQALSALAYSRNMYAKLIPLEKGILNFACSVNRYIFKYDSRVGVAPSYHAVYDALKKLAIQDAKIIRTITLAPNSSWVLRLDNVQHYVRPRHFRIGREATMKIGTAATVFEFLDFSSDALDLNNKKQRLAENKRRDLSFQKLMSMIDINHLDEICALQWLRVLVNFVPCLKIYQENVKKCYKTDCARKLLPPRKTQIFPLPTNGRNETITSELLKALLDFVNEMGYTEESPIDHLLHVGGDGLTYERMVLLKLYMQFHETSFQRLEWLQPFLETWHTSWTDLSRIYEAHWDSLLSSDPSSIGHSANQLKRKAPSNLKKVDYYPYSELAYQVLDARILDCWRVYLGGKDADLLNHFEALDKKKDLPSFEALHESARRLFQRYGHPHTFDNIIQGRFKSSETTIPPGDVWTPNTTDKSSATLNNDSGSKKVKRKAKKVKKSEDDSDEDLEIPFQGDQSLAQSCRFMYDTTISREVIYATAEGDVGRIWEALKVMILTFAGSTHTKYMNYLLEMFCDLELESSQSLRESFLTNWIINPSGQPNRFVAGDKFQEQLQDEMYEHIGRKDSGFDEDYMRRVIAPNAYRFVVVKKTVTEGLGLAQRAGKHSEPHTNPEMVKLLQTYRNHQLHLFRRGRTYGTDMKKTDDLGRGVQRLIEGKLETWVYETSRARRLNMSSNSGLPDVEIEAGITQIDQEEAQEHNEGLNTNDARTPGQIIQGADGGLVFEFENNEGSDDEHEALEDPNNYNEFE